MANTSDLAASGPLSSAASSAPGGFRPLGAVHLEARTDTTWRFAAADGASVEVVLLAADLARARVLPPGVLPAPSWAIVKEDWPTVHVHSETGENGTLTLTTAAMRLEIALDPFRLTCSWPDGTIFAADDPDLRTGVVAPYGAGEIPAAAHPAGSVRCYKRLAPGERILGAGEYTAPLDRRGQHLVFWNSDPPQPHGDDTRSMYASIPFWLGLRAGRAYGIFLDSAWRSDLDAGATRPDVLSFGVAGGDLTYYIFAGPTPAAILARYADLTGHMPLPPRWALGYAQSRWSYYPEAMVRHLAEQFRARRIPCDALWLDIDYMDGYRVFTWNSRRFPDPARLLSDLRAAGFKVVTIVDPGVKADPTDTTFREGLERDYFIRRPDGALFIGVVWAGESVFPDFTRAEVRHWWGERHRALLDPGVAAIWDDMNEPALNDRFVPGAKTPHGSGMSPDALQRPDGYGEGGDAPVPHRALHNVYGMQMARATYEGLARLRPDQRPFVLSRSGYAGIQRYAVLWTGDNSSRWDHLRLASRMCLALGLSGVPFCGFDTGGFWLPATGELLVRYTQLGAVFPFFRNHSALGTPDQEPWAFGPHVEALVRAAIELRYRLLPYLYTVFAEAARDGAPIARALIYAFPDDETLAGVDDEHLLGADLLCAPVMEEDQPRRVVHFPRGAWVDWQSGERVIGPARRPVDSPLDVLPLFVREGAILPLGPVQQYSGEDVDHLITLACYLGAEEGATASGMLYEDDGATPAYRDGAFRLTRFTAERHGGNTVTVRAEAAEGRYDAPAHGWLVELHLPYAGAGPRPVLAAARLGERALADVATVHRRYETVMCIALDPSAAPFALEVALD
jgi:alpha-glucosidase